MFGCVKGTPEGWDAAGIERQAAILLKGILQEDSNDETVLEGLWCGLDGDEIQILGCQRVKIEHDEHALHGLVEGEDGVLYFGEEATTNLDLKACAGMPLVCVSTDLATPSPIHTAHELYRLLTNSGELYLFFTPPSGTDTDLRLVLWQRKHALLLPRKSSWTATFSSTVLLLDRPANGALKYQEGKTKKYLYKCPTPRHIHWVTSAVLCTGVALMGTSKKTQAIVKGLGRAGGRVSPLCKETASRVTVKKLQETEKEPPANLLSLLSMMQTWVAANPRCTESVDPKEAAAQDLPVEDMKAAFGQLAAQHGNRVSFPEYKAVYEGLYDAGEVRELFASLSNGQASIAKPAAVQLFGEAAEQHIPDTINYMNFATLVKSPAVNAAACHDVQQDMSHPLHHYYICTSQNAFLTPDQYRSILLAGCRSLGIGIWAAPDGTLLTQGDASSPNALLRETLVAINEAAFTTSEYPVVLTLEIGTRTVPEDLPKAMLSVFENKVLRLSELGGASPPLTPEGLKHRILLCTKPTNCQALTDITAITDAGDKKSLSQHIPCATVGETNLHTVTPSMTKSRLTRLHPSEFRTGANNYNPTAPWVKGVQMAAMNFLTNDLNLRMYLARFACNSNAGYLLKPTAHRQLTISIDVMRAWRLPLHDSGSIASPYVTVEVHGAEEDMGCDGIRTQPVPVNRLNPSWAGTEGSDGVFRVSRAEVAVLVVTVRDEGNDGDIVAESVLPADSVNNGLRCLPLFSCKNELLQESGLLCRFNIEGRPEEQATPPRHTDVEDDDDCSPVVGTFNAARALPDDPLAGKSPPVMLLDGRDAGYPVVANFKRCWIVSRQDTTCVVLTNGGSLVRDVPLHKMTTVEMPQDMVEVLAIQRLRWMWRWLVLFYSVYDPLQVPHAVEVCGLNIRHPKELEDHLVRFYNVQDMDHTKFLKPGVLPSITAEDETRTLSLTSTLQSLREAAASVWGVEPGAAKSPGSPAMLSPHPDTHVGTHLPPPMPTRKVLTPVNTQPTLPNAKIPPHLLG